MSYLYARQFHGPLTDLVLAIRNEIHIKPYDEIDWNKARHHCCKEDLYYPHSRIQDLLWDTLNYCSEPLMRRWPLNKIRQKAMDKAIKYMRYNAEETRYITLGCVEKVRASAVLFTPTNCSILMCWGIRKCVSNPNSYSMEPL